MDAQAKHALEKVNAALDELDQQRTHSIANIVEGLEKIKLMFVRREEASAKETASTMEEQQAVFATERDAAESRESLLKAEIETLTAAVADRNALAEKLADYEALKESSAQKQEELDAREKAIQELEDTIRSQEENLAAQEEKLQEQESFIHDKDAALEKQEAELLSSQEELTKLQEARDTGNEELELLRANHHAFMEEIVRLKEEQEKQQLLLKEKEEEVIRLSAEIDSFTTMRQKVEESLHALEDKDKHIAGLEEALQQAAESSDKYEVQTKLLLDQLENYQQQREELSELRDQLKKSEEALQNERAAIVRLHAQMAISGRAPAATTAQPSRPQPTESLQSTVPPAEEKTFTFTPTTQRKLFGEILCEAGVVTPEQLEEALRFKASGFKRRIGTVFIELGYATAEVIAAALAAQLHLPFVDKLENRASTEAIRLVPPHLIKNHRSLPLQKEGDRLQLAMENPLDLIAIENIELATGLIVEPAVATSDEITAAIERFYTN
ncbi:MAG: hypothetical protein GX130_03875 [Candidatus Hydrogenedens sp.]|jgi:myosin heavy subunit|nr:hypothetical protein [Candidatus Hydrogenedens sp.]